MRCAAASRSRGAVHGEPRRRVDHDQMPSRRKLQLGGTSEELMCGIAGWVSFDRDLRSEQAPVDAMTETMACRGPDDQGTWVAQHAALGHRRLAIIDLPGGRQPMSLDTPNGPVAMVYSGEAYNFSELREELYGRGHRFRTDSDTEVVLHGSLEWGEAVADRLNGMYAFAIWDSRQQKLIMIRDRMGIKPL